jgi:hypothetical protein
VGGGHLGRGKNGKVGPHEKKSHVMGIIEDGEKRGRKWDK